MVVKEFCAENVECVPAAMAAGANRVELCDNLAVGGTTPSHGVIREAVAVCRARNVPVMCIIRPRGGDFEYTAAEARIMLDDLAHAAELGVDGAVFGCLRDGRVDAALTARLAEAAKDAGLLTTFHMAFDELPSCERPRAIAQLADLGIDRILTHGGPAYTPISENLGMLAGYVEAAAGRIRILPGGGVTWQNADAVMRAVGVDEAHGTKIVQLPS